METAPNVNIRTLNWRQLVNKVEDDKRPEPAYQFSNGREFNSTDNTDSGIYENS